MAYQSIWFYTDIPEDIVDIIERDVSLKFDEQMGDSRLQGDSLNKEKETHKMPGFLPIIELVGFFGIILNEQIVRTFCMI